MDVQLRAEARSVLIAVADTGPGISADDLPHIFDRFYRADKSRSRDPRSIVAAHGGRIRAESQTGQGTTIAFTLPAG